MSKVKNEVGFTAQHVPATEQPNVTDTEKSPFQRIADEIGLLVTEKNKAYGSAHIVTGEVLKLLYPNGVHIHRYRDMLITVRILDKLTRLATRPDAFGESPYRDISGYGILGVHNDSRFEGTTPPAKDDGTKI